MNTLSIDPKKEAIFSEHISLTDARFVVVEGEPVFYINQGSFHLKEQKYASSPINVAQWINAKENFQFLIIR